MSRRPSRGTLAALICACTTPAFGSPYSDSTAGRPVFTGAATPSTTSLDVNPAAFGLGKYTEYYFATTALVDRYHIDRASLDIDTGSLGDGPSGATDWTMSPGGTLGGVWHTDTRFTLAAELHTPPGERFVESNALRYATAGGYHRRIAFLSAGGSVKITAKVYIGVSLALQKEYLKLRYSRDTALEAGRDPARGIASDCGGAPCGVENRLAEERYEIDVSSGGGLSTEIVVPTLSGLVQIAKDVWVGLAWHMPPGLSVQNELTGSAFITRAPRDGGGDVRSDASVFVQNPTSFDAEVRARLPGLLELHVGARLEDLQRLQAYDVRPYGVDIRPNGIPEWQPRPRGFNWTYAMWGGVEQVDRGLGSPILFGARIGFETKATDDDRTSALTVAPLSATVDLGMQLRLSNALSVQLGYGLQYFPTVSVDDSAFDPRDRLRCMDSGFDYTTDACRSVRLGYAIPTAAGDYSRIEQAFRIAVRYESGR
jgi:hypothetical protein